jgi:hypothetical protein
MITDALLGLVVSLVEVLVSALPAVTVPFSDEVASFGSLIGSYAGMLDGLLPISEMMVPIAWAVTVYIPFVLTFYVVRWVYAKLPVVGQ